MSELRIEGLRASAGGQEILHGIDLRVPSGQVHVVMGPNGSGQVDSVACPHGSAGL